MNEEVGYLGAVTYQCLYSGALDRVRQSMRTDEKAPSAVHKLRTALKQSEASSPSFLFDLTKLLLADSGLNVNLQESFLRMQANAPTDDLLVFGQDNIPQFQELSSRAIALRRVLSRVPEEMSDRRTFLETIKEIASSIKKLLDATNDVITVVPAHAQQAVEKRKREFVHYSKRFSTTLKDYFRDQNAHQVSVSANQLIFQTSLIVKTLNDKLRRAN
ncbi:hypothetical protein PENTCL1PPCAC_7967 [Pristionchus entomophagus]|uniref:Programmed cell death protein 10 dimerisation domain-containing protein n=1 Tax=Pristionchus entomophagus TaxID=358040 RepID=A0AAV5SSN0_9BILA|nr:hypothetical protein PENTCL1PPCAC_7967 [Pristionchus entomophagus]